LRRLGQSNGRRRRRYHVPYEVPEVFNMPLSLAVAAVGVLLIALGIWDVRRQNRASGQRSVESAANRFARRMW